MILMKSGLQCWEGGDGGMCMRGWGRYFDPNPYIFLTVEESYTE